MNCNIEKELKWLKKYFEFWSERFKTKGKRVWLVGTPVYGNLGDQAIALGIRQFWTECGGTEQIIEIPSLYMRNHTKRFRPLIGKDTIWITGGGFIGSLWPKEEQMVELTIRNFPNNKICILPQTLYFTDDEQGRDEQRKFVRICQEHKNLSIFLREEKSYHIAKNLMPDANIYLAPDMALNLKPDCEIHDRKDVLLCLRNDKEKNVQESDMEAIKSAIHEFYPDEEVLVTDTVLNKNVWKNKREHDVYAKIQQFADARLVVTDRLHGMVFAALAGTPCLVCGNVNHKVKGIYKWIENNEYIYYAENKEEITEGIRILSLCNEKETVFDRTSYENCYEKLKQVLKNN